MPHHASGHLWALVLLLSPACGGADRAGSAAAAVDTLRGTITLEIGGAEGDDEYLFGRVSGLARDSQGRIFVSDAQASEVRAFAADGQFLLRVARAGSGPGEVEGPCCLALDDEGRLWVRDGGNGRYQAYRLGADGATHERGLRFQHGDRNFWAPLTFDSAGRLVDVGHTPGAQPGSVVQTRFHVAPDGTLHGREVIDDPASDSIDLAVVDRKSAAGVARLYVYRPYGSVPLVAHGPRGAWAVAASGYYVVRWVLPDGTARVITRHAPGPRLSHAETLQAEQDLSATAERLGVTVARLPFGVPERKAPLRALWFDRWGRLWVQLTPAASSSESHADVYDTSGVLVAAARWPWAVDLRHGYVDERVALGVREDSLEVQRVALVTWNR